MNDRKQNSELDKYRDIVIAGIDYIMKGFGSSPIPTHDGKLVTFTEEFEPYFSNLKSQVLILHKKNKLSILKRWFRDISEMPISSNDLNYQLYIETTTGHKIDLFGKLLDTIDNIIKRGQIKTDDQYRAVAVMIDFLQSYNPPDNKRIEQLDALQFAYTCKKGSKSRGKK